MSCENCKNSSCSSCFEGVTIPQGPIGEKGDKGVVGGTGATGATGATGSQGDPGAQGDTGIQGVQGDPGAQGDPGIQGDPGVQGVQGPQGLPGNEGAQGLQGLQGGQGDPGVNSTIFDTYESNLNLFFQLPDVAGLITGMTTSVGSGTGNYLVQWHIYISSNPPDTVLLKIDGSTIETFDVDALMPGANNIISNLWIGQIDDGFLVEIWANGDNGFSNEVSGFKFSLIRLG